MTSIEGKSAVVQPVDAPREDVGNVRVFLSYAHSDVDIADRIRHVLIDEGLAVWSPASVSFGASIVEEVSAALQESDYALMVIGPKSQDSAWVAAETAAAILARSEDPTKVVVPILSGKDTKPPMLLRDVLHLRLTSDQKAADSQIRELARSLRDRALRSSPRHPDSIEEIVRLQFQELLLERQQHEALVHSRAEELTRVLGLLFAGAVVIGALSLAIILGIRGSTLASTIVAVSISAVFWPAVSLLTLRRDRG
jgi:CTP:molybdopterin cytidylyltransferase MocA